MLLLHELKAHLEVILLPVPIPRVVEAMAEEAVASAEAAEVDLAVAEDDNIYLPIQLIYYEKDICHLFDGIEFLYRFQSRHQ